MTAQSTAEGSGKGADGWFPLSQLTVYFDHPVHATPDHTLNIDFTNPARGAGARVAVELSGETATRLVRAIAEVLAETPSVLTGLNAEPLLRLRAAAQDLVPTE